MHHQWRQKYLALEMNIPLSYCNSKLSNSFWKVVSSGTRNKFSSTIYPKFNQHSTYTSAIYPHAQLQYFCILYAHRFTVKVTGPTQNNRARISVNMAGQTSRNRRYLWCGGTNLEELQKKYKHTKKNKKSFDSSCACSLDYYSCVLMYLRFGWN